MQKLKQKDGENRQVSNDYKNNKKPTIEEEGSDLNAGSDSSENSERQKKRDTDT